MNDDYEIYLGNCLEVINKLAEKNIKVDLILTDPPYQKTQNKWDSLIPFDEMWKSLKKIRKETTPIILFGKVYLQQNLFYQMKESIDIVLSGTKNTPVDS